MFHKLIISSSMPPWFQNQASCIHFLFHFPRLEDSLITWSDIFQQDHRKCKLEVFQPACYQKFQRNPPQKGNSCVSISMWSGTKLQLDFVWICRSRQPFYQSKQCSTSHDRTSRCKYDISTDFVYFSKFWYPLLM